MRPGRKGKRSGQPFIVLTGLSGSGKSQAIRALEDLGYFCVDNLPTTLIPTLAKLSLRAGGDIEKVAIVVDVREGGFLSSFPKIFRQLRKMPRLNPILIFLEASHAALVRRFSETRRPHPLAPDRSVSEGIRDERRAAERRSAIWPDEIVDTSDMTVHELRQFFMGLSRERSRGAARHHAAQLRVQARRPGRRRPRVRRRGACRTRISCRRCGAAPGRDRAVAEFMERDPSYARSSWTGSRTTCATSCRSTSRKARAYLTIAIGCTGGRHRSVMIAERLRRALASDVGVRARARPAPGHGACVTRAGGLEGGKGWMPVPAGSCPPALPAYPAPPALR